MAVTPEAMMPVTHVVGISGSVSHGATALKSPVFEFKGRYFSGDPDSPPSQTHELTEIENYEERGLLTLFAKPVPRKQGHVILYAHADFLQPSGDTCKFKKSEWGPLVQDQRLGAHYAYIPLDDARDLLSKWGALLLADAQQHLMLGHFQRTKDSATRAYFCVERRSSPDLMKAHAYVAAARLGLNQQIRGVLRDVKVSGGNMEEVRNTAQTLFERASSLLRFQQDPHQRFSYAFAA
jgi:hypothetical protein